MLISSAGDITFVLFTADQRARDAEKTLTLQQAHGRGSVKVGASKASERQGGEVKAF